MMMWCPTQNTFVVHRGPAGSPGSSGKNSLLNVVNVPAGADCSNGGLRIDSGLDDNENGILDEEEVQVVRFLCNTAGGGFQEEIRLSFGRIIPLQRAPTGLCE